MAVDVREIADRVKQQSQFVQHLMAAMEQVIVG